MTSRPNGPRRSFRHPFPLHQNRGQPRLHLRVRPLGKRPVATGPRSHGLAKMAPLDAPPPRTACVFTRSKLPGDDPSEIRGEEQKPSPAGGSTLVAGLAGGAGAALIFGGKPTVEIRYSVNRRCLYQRHLLLTRWRHAGNAPSCPVLLHSPWVKCWPDHLSFEEETTNSLYLCYALIMPPQKAACQAAETSPDDC